MEGKGWYVYIENLEIFKSVNLFNDYSSPDMKCGDLNLETLLSKFKIINPSQLLNPYTGQLFQLDPNPITGFKYKPRKKLNTQLITEMLFDEFRHFVGYYSMFGLGGPSTRVIYKLIDRFQQNSSAPFNHPDLDRIYKSRIYKDAGVGISKDGYLSITHIEEILNNNSDKSKSQLVEMLHELIAGKKLPKFNSFWDYFNGTIISIHDIHATRIVIKHLDINKNGYDGVIGFYAQDHFGLDDNDVLKIPQNYIQPFGIWFLLQRYEKFAFKPFLFNMQSEIKIQKRL
ncbi:hypothetical protein KUI_0299 [Taylorella equigenitalis ATCC 35865]|uniref:DUF3289 family protein n=1 Tax=Taylorella equigenitalis ATCC 35865 TaxID=743973 RepID=A0ABN4AUR6_9BURK|nr:hypothetical protein KUI_0299 [Taylorella equigenitalis ATCC 35865]